MSPLPEVSTCGGVVRHVMCVAVQLGGGFRGCDTLRVGAEVRLSGVKCGRETRQASKKVQSNHVSAFKSDRKLMDAQQCVAAFVCESPGS
eukprot:366185-Chlamydomonas_euryale.AAC.4